jgi:LmbE family N-acetylglucosaminyl deacetylase
VCAWVEPLPQDRGAAGAWQKILKLRTTASAMHTTAHPDDEHGGLLTMLSRGDGARVTLLTLTRGEAGDNAIGSELFDALGLIRTEELLRADQYYGVDQQYFASVVDYGFSKRLEEALVKWGRENVLRDVVRTIRVERPLVLIARFQGNDRDGHGNHQAAGLITQEAYRVAGDPGAFPEQIREGLRPWQPLKLYMGGVRESEDWTIRVDPGVYSPWLGETFANFARTGLAFQRSQNSGRNDPQPGPAFAYYRRLAPAVPAQAKETSFFDGLDTRVSGIFGLLRQPEPSNAPIVLRAIESQVDAAAKAFSIANPSAAAPALVQGLAAVQSAIRAWSADADVVHILRLKEQQFKDAINAALGLDFTAIAQPADPVVPGQTFDVNLRLTNHGSIDVHLVDFAISGGAALPPIESVVARDGTIARTARVTVPASAPVTRPYFSRASIGESRYQIADDAAFGRPTAAPAFSATARYRIGEVGVEADVPVTRREARFPYGSVMRELAVLPRLAVNVSPRQIVLPQSTSATRVTIHVELVNNAGAGTTGAVALLLPLGWTSDPPSIPFALDRPGEQSRVQFVVAAPAVAAREYVVQAVATTVDGHRFSEGYDAIEHRDLETRYLFRSAMSRVRGVDVTIAPGLKVGYVMGVGDDVPGGIAQLGAQVTLLGSQDLATGDLGHYDAIVTGTRAYGVRADLRSQNRRLLDYARNGGNLIVLYNTPAEYDPNVFAPFPAQLPPNAEEVSEEDSPVEILSPSRPEFTRPNAIGKTDFDGWVEQRGSKFFSQWDPAYTAMIETHDQGQPPQKGGWLTAAYGKGHFTYFAYAFHRQLPYSVAGAYRLLANLLSLGRS